MPAAVRGVLGRVRRRVDAAREAAATRGDDSGMTAIEFVLLTPVLFFMIFATVQFGLYFFADHVAQAAAQAGARKARATADAQPGGWRGEANDVVDSYIRQLGPQLVLSPDVKTLQPQQDTVGVEITARIPTVFPGLDLTVHAQSMGPVERFVPEGQN
ncbi:MULTISPECIES: TadE family protein [Streptomyces]|jgi:Flp pilus assembly protein TadG|uniref:Pilus assembly protein n=1 Tax=Streptomyces olivaceus TaxID=47716 RepID=A0ABS7VWX7_STROV|nr:MULTISPECIES: TadE family protein [Streptomyces]MBF8169533.1 pilus assembly protein [Streptomyces olivaceus]MBZ6079545.1 pilus assembly protein [Streptomyces olivaceus]MBZ6086844.1 pilus assembly protein [Streptomyces olivaceus]MBZ6094555.1 pilus assembly protein [Streptomyces olivaceus]MBZ6107066.1 pilus assembly protein [Streptomyces olivaceus]